MFQLAAFVTLPFDVVKTHQQIELGEKEIYTGWQHFILFFGNKVENVAQFFKKNLSLAT